MSHTPLPSRVRHGTVDYGGGKKAYCTRVIPPPEMVGGDTGTQAMEDARKEALASTAICDAGTPLYNEKGYLVGYVMAGSATAIIGGKTNG